MPIVRYVPDPAKPFKLTPEQRARLDAMTDEEITRAAESDPDNPPLTEAELARMTGVGLAKRVRRKAGLTQEKFAEAYGINIARLRDLEQGRVQPDKVLLSYLALIEDDPERALRTVAHLNKPA